MVQTYNATVLYAPFGFERIVLKGLIGRTKEDAIESAKKTLTEVGIANGMKAWEANANCMMAKFKMSKAKSTR